MGRLSEKIFGDDLFALARRGDPATSHAAARALDKKLTGLQLKVYEAFATHGNRYLTSLQPPGLTNQELCDLTGLDWNTATPRVKPLIDRGFLKDLIIDGKPVTRISRRSGKAQIVRVIAK